MTRLTSKGKHIIKVGNHPYTNILPKPKILGRGGQKCRILKMHLQLSDQKQNNLVYIQIAKSKPQGNGNQNLQQIHTNKKNQSKHTLKIVINHKRREQERKKKDKETNPKQLINGNKIIQINNYLKYTWTKSSNKKSQTG